MTYVGKMADVAGSTPSIAHKYTGHTWDGTAQLYYAPYRYYSPATARWITRDPLGIIDGPNVYAYVMDNPVRWMDPLGAKRDYCVEFYGEQKATKCKGKKDTATCQNCCEQIAKEQKKKPGWGWWWRMYKIYSKLRACNTACLIDPKNADPRNIMKLK